MALLMSFARLLLLLTLLFSTKTSNAFDFEVGDDEGWTIPLSRNTQFYNHWASRNRFQVGDTLHFIYKKVSAEDYERCRSSHPLFFSNNGNTEFKLNHSGLLYFISGVSHCERGQKMTIKVLSHPDSEGPNASSSSSNQTERRRGGVGEGGRGEDGAEGVERKRRGSLGIIKKNKGANE